jgi:hypothetical protein
MYPAESRHEAVEAARQWIIAQRDSAAKGALIASVLLLVLAIASYIGGGLFLLVVMFALIPVAPLAVAVSAAVLVVSLVTALFGAFVRRRHGIPFADGRVYPERIEVDGHQVDPHDHVGHVEAFMALRGITDAAGGFARWLTLQWIDELRTARDLLRLDALVAAEMLECGLDAEGAAPLIDLECVPGAKARTLQALCAIPGIMLRGGSKPGLVVSDDARRRILSDLGWQELENDRVPPCKHASRPFAHGCTTCANRCASLRRFSLPVWRL